MVGRRTSTKLKTKFRRSGNPSGWSKFQSHWTRMVEYKDWLEPVSTDEYLAYCKVCNKYLDIHSMGHQGIYSHNGGKKHKAAVRASSVAGNNARSITQFLSVTQKKPVQQSKTNTVIQAEHQTLPSTAQVQGASTSSVVNIVDHSFETKLVERAVCLWVMKTVDSNNSFNSNNNIKQILEMCFPDSNIIKRFSCGRTKTSYIMVFGIGPYVQKGLKNMISESSKEGGFVLLFDESHNESLDQKQLDFHVRFWHDGKVVTRYLTSEFMGKARVVDFVEVFRKLDNSGLISSLSNVIQFGMDGPNVNLKLLDVLIEEFLLPQYGHKVLDIGTCPLHQVHNALKKASHKNGWGVGYFLQSVWFLLHKVPARKEEYQTVTDSYIMPLKFCSHRWVENIRPARRALQMLSSLRTYVNAVDNKVRDVKDPATHSYATVKEFVQDKLAAAKLAFFVFMAEPIESFLTKFQSEKPMAPLLVEELKFIFADMTAKFVLSETNKKVEPMQMNFSDPKILKKYYHIKTGREVRTHLNILQDQDKLTTAELVNFKEGCRSMYIAFLEHMKIKSPLNKTLANYITCLNPTVMVEEPALAEKRFGKVCDTLCDVNMLQDAEIPKLQRQYEKLLKICARNPAFTQFDNDKDRLDDLFYEAVADKHEYSDLWKKVICKVLLLSHGQAQVEMGFSVNKQALEVNQSAGSLIARRLIKDHLRFIDGIDNFTITDELLKSCSQAHSRYQQHLKEQDSNRKKTNTQSNKRKRVEEGLIELRKKKKIIVEERQHLQAQMVEVFKMCAQTQDYTDHSVGVACMESVEVKNNLLEQVEKDIEEQSNLLKCM